MATNAEELELKDRIRLIESMIAEGRRTTESYGWTFVFWGVAYYIAISWTAWTHWPWAWLVTMAGAWVLCWAIIVNKKKKNTLERRPGTTIGRAIFAIWISMGISLSLLLPALGFSDRFNQHIFVAIVAAMLGVANGASGMMIRWKAQVAVAIVWWAASVAACFGSDDQCTAVFLVAIFFCQIVFGVYAMIWEARVRKQQEALHA
jgi:peptidoglycan/LPS O-acetylase OafA/YrhL